MTNDHLKRFGGLYLLLTLLVTNVSDYMFVPTQIFATASVMCGAVAYQLLHSQDHRMTHDTQKDQVTCCVHECENTCGYGFRV
jgi:hypothetical protein